jgi:predicted phosphodiesterase
MSKITQSGKLAREYLTKFPSSSISSLAKLLIKDHPAVFTSVEGARSTLRGHSDPNYHKNRPTKLDVIPRAYKFTSDNPFGLPESQGHDRKFFQLNGKKILWLSDIHFPNQDNGALSNALQYGKDDKIDCIVIGGDLFDNEPFTSHLAPPPILSDVRLWFELVGEFLDMLKIKFPKASIHFMEGNHDAWYKRYLMSKATLLFHDEYFTLSARLKLREKGILFHPENTIVNAGKLPLSHGHMIVKGFFSPVNPAKGVFNKIKSSMLIGHCHQTSEHSESTLKGEVITTYSTGCLCTLAPNYDPFNTRHNLGFARIDVDKMDNYKVYNKRIDFFTKDVY